ncbi:MAG: Ppx/GppA family phosphatase [Actinobacteria bacterium]|nr:Ppx/GppA family phosphatase [Actinomycetota bacterium]
MTTAVVDIGTNSVRLLIAQKGGGWRDILRTVEVTRLGEGVDCNRIIKKEAMERTLATLAEYKDLMDRHGVQGSRIISTSAMRDAKNAAEFIELVKERLGFDIEVISGKEEGRLTFAGATGMDSLVSEDDVALVVDVGGGSTEYIYGKSGQVFGAMSIDVGSVRLTELFIKHDPPIEDELTEARGMIRRLTEPVFKEAADENPSVLVAVAGTATQLSAVHYRVEPYDPERIHGSKITLAELKGLIAKLASLKVDVRRELPGMRPERADVIVAGALILDETMSKLCFPEMVISEKDILDGLLYSLDD